MVNMMKKYYKNQAKSMYEMRSIRHDIQAHMIVLQYYLEKEKYQDAKEYLQSMRMSQNFNNEPMVDTGNDLVNAIAYEIVNGNKTKIKLFCEGYIPEKINISDFDMCTLFSNLFTNAVEACEKVVFHEKKIMLQLEKSGKDFLIHISNPIEWEVDKNILGVGTTKEDKHAHGYGIRNIINTVKNNGGTIDFSTLDGVFKVDINFPDVMKK